MCSSEGFHTKEGALTVTDGSAGALWFGAITIADFCGEVDTTLFLQHLELEKTQRFTIAQLLSLRTHVLRRYIKKTNQMKSGGSYFENVSFPPVNVGNHGGSFGRLQLMLSVFKVGLAVVSVPKAT